jgi:RND family efflux transporter MFP subunit
MGNLLKWILPLLLLAGGVYWWMTGRETEVIVAEATRGTAVDAVTGTVEILAAADLWVRTEREGELVEVPVRIGDVVKKGDLIARQQSDQLDIQLEMESARLKAAKARLEVPLQSNFDLEAREKDLEALQLQVEMGQTSRSRLDDLELEVRKVRARLQEETIAREEAAGVLAARVKDLQYQRDQMVQLAPIGGEVVEIIGIIGNQLNGRQNVVRIVSDDRIVEMELNEEDYGGVEIGDPVTVRLASYPNREFKAEVSNFFATANSNEKTRKLFLKVDAENRVLVPGLTGEGLLIKDERANTVVIPRRALVGNRVYVVVDGEIEIRKVTTGFLALNRAEILEGVQPGEQVVLENQDLLSDGQSVKIRQP